MKKEREKKGGREKLTKKKKKKNEKGKSQKKRGREEVKEKKKNRWEWSLLLLQNPMDAYEATGGGLSSRGSRTGTPKMLPKSWVSC